MSCTGVHVFQERQRTQHASKASAYGTRNPLPAYRAAFYCFIHSKASPAQSRNQLAATPNRHHDAQEHYVRGAVRGTPAMLHACVQSLACAAPVLAHELIDIGAVYLGQPIKGQNVIKWRRIIDLPGGWHNIHRHTYATNAGGTCHQAACHKAAGNNQPAWPVPALDASTPGYELIRGGLGSPLLPGTLLRVHTSPKRYPACGTTDWPASLVHVDDDFVVVNKPSGLPCMRHVSNAREEVSPL